MSEQQATYSSTWAELSEAISGSSDPAYVQEKKQVEQQSKDWFAVRLGKFTASRMPDLMGRGRGELFGAKAVNYVRLLIIERTLAPDKVDEYIEQQMTSDFKQTRWGIKYEPEARAEFEKWLGKKVNKVTFRKGKYNFFGGSADFENLGIPGEIKCPYNVMVHQSNLDLQLTGIDKSHTYYAQIQAHIMNFNSPYCWFVSYDPRRESAMKLAVIKVDRDDEYISELEERLMIAEKAVTANIFEGITVYETLNGKKTKA